VPALPVLGVAGGSHEEPERLITEATELHLRGMIEDGVTIPEPGVIDVGEIELPIPV
jgi:predicted RNase H-like HicB family nuclease